MSRSGYVYILTNPCFNAYFKSKIVKIGQAKDVQKRVATLNTSVPVRFEVYATLCTSKYKIVEKKIHQRLKGVSAIKELHGQKRVKAENGEFYLITPAQALKVLKEESVLIDESDKKWKVRGKAPVSSGATAHQSWANMTQLAKILAARDGNVGAAGGVLQLLSRKRPCKPNSKWRKPFESAGLKFDAEDKVIDWSHAKNPL